MLILFLLMTCFLISDNRPHVVVDVGVCVVVDDVVDGLVNINLNVAVDGDVVLVLLSIVLRC